MAEKDKLKTSPLQQDKKVVIDNLVDQAATERDTGTEKDTRPGVKPGTKRGAYKKEKAKTIPRSKVVTVDEPAYTFEMAKKDASFLSAFVNSFRMQAGIGPIRKDHQEFFEHSACQMYMKYGPSAARWMPEVMFGGSLFVILIDTAAQIKKLKVDRKRDTGDTVRADVAAGETETQERSGADMELTGTPDMAAGGK